MSSERTYAGFFRIHFNEHIQYRAAAFAGVATQFAWGFFNIAVFSAFYVGNADTFPMEMQQLASYIWLRQAFLALFNMWRYDNSIFGAIVDGNIAYELTRPLDLYSMWFSKNLAMRLAAVTLRFAPILLVAALLPAPIGLGAPAGFAALTGFLFSMLLSALVTCALLMLVYISTFFTMQPGGVRMLVTSMAELLAGDLVPLPFLPNRLAAVLEYLPFASMGNVPFRVYSGNIAGGEMLHCIGLQLVWLAVLVLAGRSLMSLALKRTEVQGG